LSSAGGNISLKGKSSAGANSDGDFASAGIRFRDSAATIDINSGSGTISMDGVSQSTYTGGHASGVMIGGYGSRTTIQSTSSASNAIEIVGTGTTANTNASGIWINSTASILSKGTGGISLTGTERRAAADAGGTETAGVFFKQGKVFSASGQISVTGVSNLTRGIDLSWSGGWIGGKTGTSVPTSSANVVLTSDSMWLGSSSTAGITTSGNVTLQNYTAGTAVNIGGADVTAASGSPRTLGVNQSWSLNCG
jgi:hypothetical protein